jgi:hypothetical protein
MAVSELDGLLDRHGLSRGDLVAAVHELPAGPRDSEPLADGHTVKDVICHIVAREEAAARAIEAFARGRPLVAPEFMADPAGFDALAREKLGALDWGALWDRADEVRKALLGALMALYGVPPERYAEDTPVRPLLDQASHEERHASAIEAWRRARGF